MAKILRSKKSTPPVADPPAPRPPAAPRITPPAPPANVRDKKRVLLTTIDGRIDWQGMSPESRRQFEELFRDPKFLAQFGASLSKVGWDPEQIKHLYDALGVMSQAIAALFLRWPPEAVAVLGYTKNEKDMLAEPTAAVANEYSGKWIQEHQSLAVWGGLFFSIVQAKFMHGAALAKRAAIARAPGRRPVAVGSPPTQPAAPAPAAAPGRASEGVRMSEKRVIIPSEPAGGAGESLDDPIPPTNGHATVIPESAVEGSSLEEMPEPAEMPASLDDDMPGGAVVI